MRKNKKGWVRILEVTIAILIISSAMLIQYKRVNIVNENEEKYLEKIGQDILDEAKYNDDIRLTFLKIKNDSYGEDQNYKIMRDRTRELLDADYNFTLKVCDLDDLSDQCKMDAGEVAHTILKDVYVSNINLELTPQVGGTSELTAKKVKLYIWKENCDSEKVFVILYHHWDMESPECTKVWAHIPEKEGAEFQMKKVNSCE